MFWVPGDLEKGGLVVDCPNRCVDTQCVMSWKDCMLRCAG